MRKQERDLCARLNGMAWLGRTNWEIWENIFGEPRFRSCPPELKEPYIVYDELYSLATVRAIVKLADAHAMNREAV